MIPKQMFRLSLDQNRNFKNPLKVISIDIVCLFLVHQAVFLVFPLFHVFRHFSDDFCVILRLIRNHPMRSNKIPLQILYLQYKTLNPTLSFPTIKLMSRPYFIQLYDSKTNVLLNKFKFVLQASSVKQVKDLIIEKLINKNQVKKDDTIVIKDNDEYELGSDDEVNDVIPDGKVKLFIGKTSVNLFQNPIQNQQLNTVQSQPIQQVPQQTVLVTNNSQSLPSQSNVISSPQISLTTNVLDMNTFIIPLPEKTDKHILKVVCPQIRKSVIEIPIREDFEDFIQFSTYVVKSLGLNKQLKTVLFNQDGCPFVNNIDLFLTAFPKLDYSEVHFVVFTKTPSTCDVLPQSLMYTKNNPEMIKITKVDPLNPLDIKFEIDLANTVAVLKYKVYEMTKIHPSNQILKFGNNILSNELQTLAAYGIKQDSIVQLSFKLNSNIIPSTHCDKFFYKDVKLINQQSELSIQSLKANLIVFINHIVEEDQNKFLAALQRYSDNLSLVYAFKSLFTGTFVSQASRIALEEGLYSCMLNFIKGLKTIPAIKKDEIFLYIRNFLGYILESMTKIKDIQKVNRHFQSVVLRNTCYLSFKTIKSPAMIKLDNGKRVVVDQESMEEQINKGLTYDEYKKPNKQDLKKTSELQEVWRIFTQNHLDNGVFEMLFWVGRNDTENEQFNLAQANCEIQAYLPKINTYPNLEINNPLQLKNKVHSYLLLQTKENRLRVFVSKNKDISKPFNLFDPITGNEEACNLDLMSGAVSTENTEVKINKADLKPIITREPKEAIVVLFDVSGSMGSKFFNQPDLSRMGAVKSFFEAFAYRTVAYNLEHVVSLYFFDDKIDVQCDFTEAIFDFNRLISEAQPRGCTKLYDSIVLAAQNLIQFQKRYPQCKLRILALTDGEDNSSSYTYIDAAKILIANNVIIDSFAVGSGCDGLKNITLASGGKCYLTRSLEDSLKLFEQQTVLSVRVRSVQENRSNLSVEQLIEDAKLKPFNEVNGVHKFKLPEIKATGKSGMELAKKLQGEDQVKKISGNNALKRIVRQIQNYTKEPHPFVSIYPSEDLNYWKILLLGPNNTPYENGLFLLYAKFPVDYPFRAPQVRFITPIYHCNMNSQGRICHSVFDRNYSPALTFKQIIECVYGLILTPQPEDPLDNVIASFYLSDYQIYLKNAKEATAKNASPAIEKLVQELYGNIVDDIERQKKVKEVNEWIEQAKKHN